MWHMHDELQEFPDETQHQSTRYPTRLYDKTPVTNATGVLRYTADSAVYMYHILVTRILYKEVVGGQFRRRDREDELVGRKCLAGK